MFLLLECLASIPPALLPPHLEARPALGAMTNEGDWESGVKHKMEYVLLAVTGLSLLLIGCYTQWLTTDLNRYSLHAYVTMDIRLWTWWSIVGIPFLAGIVYLSAAFIGWKKQLAGSRYIALFIAGLALAITLWLLVGGPGFLASVLSVGNLLYVVLAGTKRRKRSDSAL